MSTPLLSSDAFRELIGHFASGVTVVTTTLDGVDHGTTANAVTSLSVDPPTLIVCMNRASATGAAMAKASAFAVNILAEGQADLAARFATKGDAKFAGVAIERSPAGPLLTGALATIECRVREVTDGGTHTIFIAAAEHGAVRGGDPLAYFRGSFGRLSSSQDEQLCEVLRRRVVQDDLRAGERLDVGALAGELGAPRDAVYHALMQLRAEGLATRGDDGGFAVLQPSLQTALDVFDAVFALWLGVAVTTIESVSERDLRRLESRLERLRPRPLDADWSPAEFVAARNELLDTFVRLAQSDALLRAWRQVDLPALVTARWAAEQAPGPDTYEEMYQGFARVIDAYARRDVEALAEQMRRFHAYAQGLIEAAYGQSIPSGPAVSPARN